MKPFEDLSDRELDALVAEKVMGLELHSHNNGEVSIVLKRCTHDSSFIASYKKLPHYSTDIKAAWEVVKLMQSLDWGCQVGVSVDEGEGVVTFSWGDGHIHGSRRVSVDWDPDGPVDTEMKAICIAALKAMGVDLEWEKTQKEMLDMCDEKGID